MQWHEERRAGFPVGPQPSEVVPIVPAAVIFDLGRGGSFANRPDAAFGYRACAASPIRLRARWASVGAGTGALAGGLQGGVGTASITLADGIVVGALAVVNAAGQVIDPARPAVVPRADEPPPTVGGTTRGPWSTPPGPPLTPLNTTIGVVATSATLTKPECRKMAAVAHDGLARAIRPVHSMFDGDTIFCLSTGEHDLGRQQLPRPCAAPTPVPALVNTLLAAAADCFALACTRAVVEAESLGGAPSYADLCPDAFPAPK